MEHKITNLAQVNDSINKIYNCLTSGENSINSLLNTLNNAINNYKDNWWNEDGQNVINDLINKYNYLVNIRNSIVKFVSKTIKCLNLYRIIQLTEKNSSVSPFMEIACDEMSTLDLYTSPKEVYFNSDEVDAQFNYLNSGEDKIQNIIAEINVAYNEIMNNLVSTPINGYIYQSLNGIMQSLKSYANSYNNLLTSITSTTHNYASVKIDFSDANGAE